MADRKFSAFTNNPSRVPLDTLVGLDISAAANAQDSYWSLNTLFSEITGNITDGALRFGGFAAPAVSAAGKGAIYFDSGANAFQVSQNGGAYAGWILGTIANTQVAVGSAANTITGSSSLTFASSVLAISGAANPGVTATGTGAGAAGFTADQTVSGAASYAFYYMQTSSTAALLQLTTAGFTPANLVKANQLRLLGAAGTVEMLYDLADASTRHVFGVNNVEAASINATATLGLVLGAASTLTGRVRMYNSAGTTYSQISAGNAGSSLNFIWPVVNPTAGQVLSASAPSGSDVTLSWVAQSGGASLTATYVGFGSGANALTGEAAFTYGSTNGTLDVTKAVNTTSYLSVTNTSNGTASRAGLFVASDVVGGGVYSTSSGFTPASGIVANAMVLSLDAPNAIIQGQTGQTISTLLGATTRLALTDAQYAITTAPTTGSGLSVAASTVTTGNLVSIAMTGTAAASNTKTGLSVTSSGANGTATQTVTAASFSCTNTGTTNTNVALTLTASGAATANTALNVTAGQVTVPDGTASLPSYSFNGDTNCGFYHPQADFIAVAAGGSGAVAFSSNAGHGAIQLGPSAAIGWATALTNNSDTFLRRNAAANLALGATDAAAPVAQSLSVQNVVTGTANTAGVDFTLNLSRSTGSQNGGGLLIKGTPAGGAGSTVNAQINSFVVTGDGRIYGAALHNNTNSVLGTTNQYIASGTYTPTVTAVSNCDSVGDLGLCQWIRVGNVVTVSGEVTVDPTTAATLTQVGISFPIASDIAGNNQCCGTAVAPAIVSACGAILGDTTNDRAELTFVATADVASRAWVFTFTYLIS